MTNTVCYLHKVWAYTDGSDRQQAGKGRCGAPWDIAEGALAAAHRRRATATPLRQLPILAYVLGTFESARIDNGF